MDSARLPFRAKHLYFEPRAQSNEPVKAEKAMPACEPKYVLKRKGYDFTPRQKQSLQPCRGPAPLIQPQVTVPDDSLRNRTDCFVPVPDGRTDANGLYHNSFSTGQTTVPKQTSFEAILEKSSTASAASKHASKLLTQRNQLFHARAPTIGAIAGSNIDYTRSGGTDDRMHRKHLIESAARASSARPSSAIGFGLYEGTIHKDTKKRSRGQVFAARQGVPTNCNVLPMYNTTAFDPQKSSRRGLFDTRASVMIGGVAGTHQAPAQAQTSNVKQFYPKRSYGPVGLHRGQGHWIAGGDGVTSSATDRSQSLRHETGYNDGLAVIYQAPAHFSSKGDRVSGNTRSGKVLVPNELADPQFPWRHGARDMPVC